MRGIFPSYTKYHICLACTRGKCAQMTLTPTPTPMTPMPMMTMDNSWLYKALVDLGGVPGTPPYRTQFFHFCIHFQWKAPVLEVHAPPNKFTPPYGRSWIHHCKALWLINQMNQKVLSICKGHMCIFIPNREISMTIYMGRRGNQRKVGKLTAIWKLTQND